MTLLADPSPACEPLLLAEARHRTANAFQMVSAMLVRESRQVEDRRARQALLRADAQLRAFALSDAALCRSPLEADGAACAAAHPKRVCAELQPAFLTPLNVGMMVIAPEPQMRRETDCRHLGLIATELVLNATKHAFGGRAEGKIHVTLGRGPRDGPLCLVVADDGHGFGDAEIDPARGLGFVGRLAETIGASLDIATSASGTVFTVTLARDHMPTAAAASDGRSAS